MPCSNHEGISILGVHLCSGECKNGSFAALIVSDIVSEIRGMYLCLIWLHSVGISLILGYVISMMLFCRFSIVLLNPLRKLHGLLSYPKNPCADIAYTLALKHLYRDNLTANVYTYEYMDP